MDSNISKACVKKMTKREQWEYIKQHIPHMAEFMIQWQDSVYIDLDKFILVEGSIEKVEILTNRRE